MQNLKLKDFLEYKYLSNLELSQDKTHGAFVVKKANEKNNNYDSDLYCFDCNTEEVKKMTSMHDVQSFVWLNNEALLFAANRDKEIQEKTKNEEQWTVYYKLELAGGEAEEYMRIPLTVIDMKPAKENLFVLTGAFDPTRPELEAMEGNEKEKALSDWKENQDYEILDEIPYWRNGNGFTNKKRNRLYIYDKEKETLKAITAPLEEVFLEEVTSQKFLYTTREFENKMENNNALHEFDFAASESKTIIEQGTYSIYHAGYIDDDIYFEGTDMLQFGLNQNSIFYLIKNGKETPWLREDIAIGNSVGSDCRLGGGKNIRVFHHALYFTVTLGFHAAVYRLDKEGNFSPVITTEGTVDCFDMQQDKIWFIGMRKNKLQELYVTKKETEYPITNMNEFILENKNIITPEYFVFENNGVKLDGFVLKPVDYDNTKKYPAILDIHGGPKTVYGTVFFHEMQLWANEGYFVFYCNPRGGDGKGNEFADIRGKYGMIDYDDLMVFTDNVIEKYTAIDVEKLAVTGGSYGGFMTNWIIGQTNRFRCAASQRSISNWISMAYTTDIGYYFAEDQTAATPWTDFEKMWAQSPLKFADKVKTPTLFIHSEQDYRCWVPEGLQMFTALKYFGVPARLCMFKGENHELSRSGKPKHRVRRLEELTSWFNSYLK